eukprot:6315656-Amphidinium_carterae.1
MVGRKENGRGEGVEVPDKGPLGMSSQSLISFSIQAGYGEQNNKRASHSHSRLGWLSSDAKGETVLKRGICSQWL